jgi:hypothetical protein
VNRDPFAEWRISEDGFPAAGGASEKLRYLVGYAILAPSGHNTQPWLFGLDGDRLHLRADRTRRLPVVDPADRALAISCGAALGNLRAAMLRFGYRGDIELLPDPSDRDLLAIVALGGEHVPTEPECERFRAITRRRTTRTKFESEPLPPGLAGRLAELAAAEGRGPGRRRGGPEERPRGPDRRGRPRTIRRPRLPP